MEATSSQTIGFEAAERRLSKSPRSYGASGAHLKVPRPRNNTIQRTLGRTKWAFAIWNENGEVHIKCPGSTYKASLVKHLGLFLASRPELISAFKMSFAIAETWLAAEEQPKDDHRR